jgi:hypothetical protein
MEGKEQRPIAYKNVNLLAVCYRGLNRKHPKI